MGLVDVGAYAVSAFGLGLVSGLIFGAVMAVMRFFNYS